MDDFLMYESAEEYYNTYIDDETLTYGKRCGRKIIAEDSIDRYDRVREDYEE